MSSDINVLREPEMQVFHAEAETAAGAVYVDSYMPATGSIQVLDSGRIIAPLECVEQFEKGAAERGLTLA